ncbi:hypothetical protein [uncultured Rummeliibacillus sp.]|nr:hypothetical protein [uncultured Rummeliibacillus sp.]
MTFLIDQYNWNLFYILGSRQIETIKKNISVPGKTNGHHSEVMSIFTN